MAFKLVISEPKTKKAYQVEKDAPSLIGLKIGSKFDGGMMGLSGFYLEITGGSDKEGFPMRSDLEGTARKKVLLTKSVGFRGGKTKKVKGKKKYLKVKGMRKRKYVRGNTVSDEIIQINCKIVEGEGDVASLLGIKKEGDKMTEEERTEEQPQEEEKKEEEEEKKEEETTEETPAEETAEETKEE